MRHELRKFTTPCVFYYRFKRAIMLIRFFKTMCYKICFNIAY